VIALFDRWRRRRARGPSKQRRRRSVSVIFCYEMPRKSRVRRLPWSLAMPGLEPGILAAPSVIIRGRRPWMHGSIPCMTKTESGALISPPMSYSEGRERGWRSARIGTCTRRSSIYSGLTKKYQSGATRALAPAGATSIIRMDRDVSKQAIFA